MGEGAERRGEGWVEEELGDEGDEELRERS